MKPTTALRCFSLFALLSALPATGYSLGFRIVDQSAEGTARGEAFAATADDPSAVYYNPAGITQLSGTRALLGAYGISLKDRVELDTPGDHSKFSSSNVNEQIAPTFYATWKPDNAPIALGLGLYVPYGFSIEYPDNTPIRTLARKGSIQYFTINPVIAWKICDQLSVAAGPTIDYGRAQLSRGVIAPGDEFQFKGDGVAYGFNAGIMWDPHPMHHFGVTYRSATRLDFSGHSTVDTDAFNVATPFGPVKVPSSHSRVDADASFDFPQNVVVGYSFRPTPDWNFEFNLDWTDWDSLNTVTLHQSSGDVLLPFNWKSSFMYEFGITKKFSHGFHASIGYIYSENSVPTESFNPQIPDSNRHIFSGGVGQTYDHFNWMVAYQYSWGPTRHVDNGTLANGDYQFQGNAVTISLGYNF